MKVAVVGLGIEGTHALHSLLDFGHQVYASDLNEDLNITLDNFDSSFEIELGNHDWDKINSADAVVVSPSLWKTGVLKK
jgi:UDP-N-acetylmuramoylalanine-D-glutamate ligase